MVAPGDEIKLMADWIYSACAADATITAAVGTRIYPLLAEQGAAFPRLLYQPETELAGEGDVYTLGWSHIWLRTRWLITLIDQYHGTTRIDAAIAALVTALHGAEYVDVDGGQIIWCQRKESFWLPQEIEGLPVHKRGYFFEIAARAD